MKKLKSCLLCIACIAVTGLVIFMIARAFNNQSKEQLRKVAEHYKITATGNAGNEEVTFVDDDMDVKDIITYVNVLEFPQYDILAYIYDDVSKESLDYGVGHYKETKEIGELGNCAIVGHSSETYNCVLNNLKNVGLLDEFYAYDKKGNKHRYYVTDIFTVDEEDTYVLDTEDDSVSVITIITCTESGKRRLIVRGTELSDDELNSLASSIIGDKMTGIIECNDSIVMPSLYEYFSQERSLN